MMQLPYTVVDQQKFIVVYPDGLNRCWSFGKQPSLGGVDDLGVIHALVQQLVKDLKIDQRRIWAAGMPGRAGYTICRWQPLASPASRWMPAR